jgi:cytochrome c biogenesis protein CcmG, thiol:disulfide interchange protein DsbE
VTVAPDHVPSGRRIVLVIPLVIFVVIVAPLVLRLGAGDPGRIPSALIGHPAPTTELAPIPGLERDGKPLPGLTSIEFLGRVTLVNVWASWCAPCRDEAPLLMRLAGDQRLRVVGINYKDDPDNARRFLGRHGNPFAASGVDPNGRTAIEWGVYGVPETFLVGRDGRIAYKLVGPITADNYSGIVMPEIEKVIAAAAGS